MIELSKQRASDRNSKVQFILGDCTKMEFEPESFNLICSRDSLLHVQDKTTLFQKIKDWLKPSGKVLITDYCCGSSDWSRELKAAYDRYPKLKMVYTGSSIIQLFKGSGDLSRRKSAYSMVGFSFREYLKFNGILDHKHYSLTNILKK